MNNISVPFIGFFVKDANYSEVDHSVSISLFLFSAFIIISQLFILALILFSLFCILSCGFIIILSSISPLYITQYLLLYFISSLSSYFSEFKLLYIAKHLLEVSSLPSLPSAACFVLPCIPFFSPASLHSFHAGCFCCSLIMIKILYFNTVQVNLSQDLLVFPLEIQFED